MFCAIDQCGKMPSDAVAGDQRDRPRDCFARARARGGVEDGEQQIGLAVAGEAREADDLALPRDEFLSVRLALGAHPHADRRLAARPAGSGLGPGERVRFRLRPSRRPASSRSKFCDASAATTLPSRITTMRSQVFSTSPRICEMRAQLTPAATERRT